MGSTRRQYSFLYQWEISSFYYWIFKCGHWPFSHAWAMSTFFAKWESMRHHVICAPKWRLLFLCAVPRETEKWDSNIWMFKWMNEPNSNIWKLLIHCILYPQDLGLGNLQENIYQTIYERGEETECLILREHVLTAQQLQGWLVAPLAVRYLPLEPGLFVNDPKTGVFRIV